MARAKESSEGNKNCFAVHNSSPKQFACVELVAMMTIAACLHRLTEVHAGHICPIVIHRSFHHQLQSK
jgi:hypothetical protein